MCGRIRRAMHVRRYRVRDEWQDQPHDARDEIAYLGPERQDRYERHDWNFTAVEVVGTGPASNRHSPGTLVACAAQILCLTAAARWHRDAGEAQIPDALLWRASTGAAGSGLGMATGSPAAGRGGDRPGCRSSAAVAAISRGGQVTDRLGVHGASRRRLPSHCQSPAGTGRRAHHVSRPAYRGARCAAPRFRVPRLRRQKARPADRRKPPRQMLVSLRDADVYLDGAHVLRNINMVVQRGAMLGGAWSQWFGQVDAAAHNLWRPWRGQRGKHRARRDFARSFAAGIPCPHCAGESAAAVGLFPVLPRARDRRVGPALKHRPE